MEQPMQLEGKVAIVTGAGAGIGQATALLLAKAGAKVTALDLKQAEAQQTVDKIHQQGGEGLVAIADVSQPDSVQQAIQNTEALWGRLDVVFANAGINGTWAPIDELSLEDCDKTLSINLTGTFLTVKYAVPLLKRQGGSIIITSSVNGTRVFSNTGATAYAF